MIMILSSFSYLRGESKDTVYISDFGIRPYSYENCVDKLQAAINKCKRTHAKVLSFDKGRYDIWPDGAIRKEYFISNTSSEKECPSKVKTVGLLYQDMQNLIIEGNGATLMFHGKMTPIVFDHCRNMKMRNIHVDFERPTSSELQYIRQNDNEVEVRIHPDTRYEIIDGKINLYGEGWKSNRNHCVEYDPETETFIYSKGWKILSESEAKKVSYNTIRFLVPKKFHAKVGNTLTVRDIIRDEVGMFIFESQDITLDEIQMHYMHGMGIVSQYSENILMKHVNCSPRQGSGRILAASADMLHFSGCKGEIIIDSCYFSGAQDDAINIHGTNLRIIKKVDQHTLRLRFMHHQSYGFNAYFPHDKIVYVRASTMERYASAIVHSVKRISAREIELKLVHSIPAEMELNHDCIENMTWTPEVVIRNSFFTRTSTRGTLVTTPRKVLIENNTYYKTGMSAILIEGDAKEWFESGPVCNVQIKGNTFIDCASNGGPADAVIAVNPSNTVISTDHPVHKNIRIENNLFKSFDYPILYAKSTRGLPFLNNTIERTYTLPPSSSNHSIFYLNGCKGVIIHGTMFTGEFPEKSIYLKNMKRNYLKNEDYYKIINK